MKISGVYKITNTITGDFYIGSSNDVKRRWVEHKKPSTWNSNPNKQLYQDMQKFGVNGFVFEVLEEVEAEKLKEKEQEFIETLNPTYNSNRANGWDIEKCKKSRKKAQNKYYSQLCSYNGETLTLGALKMRFRRKGFVHPAQEAKKYLIKR